MEDDPDYLAAAFFAQQAAREAQKTALPTKDWIRVIHDTTANTGEVDAEKWLAMTLPHAQVESDNSKRIVGIILNRESCFLEKKNDSGTDEDEYDTEMRDKIKQLLLQKIQNNLQKSDTDEKNRGL